MFGSVSNSGGLGPDYTTPTEWLRGQGRCSDVVMSSRVRLARNLAAHRFVPQADRTQRAQVLSLCRRAVERVGPLRWVDVHTAQEFERRLLVERQLMSRQHARGKLAGGIGGPDEPRGLAVSLPDERLSIMVNEEDHLRIQVMRSGLGLADALAAADAADDMLEEELEYAFSPRFGYLTACPTNVGTGARFSVMMHLPGLKLLGDIDKVRRAAEDMSLAVRGFFGEGSEAVGDLFQISNQTTLGKTEQVLLHEMEAEIIPRVIDYERHARRMLVEKRRMTTLDRVYRALGTLRHARLISTDEAMELLSLVRLGVLTQLIPAADIKPINALLLFVQQAHLQQIVGRELTQQERRSERARILRERLADVG
ncbi:MAG: ATP--guanido phosphotransferase [Planctomycetota bacterium]|nr:MAG: ATP--guanido phosphotransferase [Planctomycetota bacterium]